MRKKLTPKEAATVKDYTDIKNKETYLNGTQAVLKNYNVKTPETAAVIASRMLSKDNVQQAIQKKIHTTEELKEVVSNLVNKLQTYVDSNEINDETVSNIALISDKLLKATELQGKFHGAFADKTTNNFTQIVINGAIQSPYDNDKSNDKEVKSDVIDVTE